MSHPILLIYGRSGAGKTSIFNAQIFKFSSNSFYTNIIRRAEEIDNDVWGYAIELVEQGILKTEEVCQMKDHFLDLVRSSEELARESGWDSVNELIEKGVLKTEEVREVKQYLLIS